MKSINFSICSIVVLVGRAYGFGVPVEIILTPTTCETFGPYPGVIEDCNCLGTCGGSGVCMGPDVCTDSTTTPSCAVNQVFYDNPGLGTMDTGISCDPDRAGCDFTKQLYGWKCCDCPPGYINMYGPSVCGVTNTALNDFCVGCSDPNEIISGDPSTGYFCTTPGGVNPTSPTPTSTSSTTTSSADSTSATDTTSSTDTTRPTDTATDTATSTDTGDSTTDGPAPTPTPTSDTSPSCTDSPDRRRAMSCTSKCPTLISPTFDSMKNYQIIIDASFLDGVTALATCITQIGGSSAFLDVQSSSRCGPSPQDGLTPVPVDEVSPHEIGLAIDANVHVLGITCHKVCLAEAYCTAPAHRNKPTCAWTLKNAHYRRPTPYDTLVNSFFDCVRATGTVQLGADFNSAGDWFHFQLPGTGDRKANALKFDAFHQQLVNFCANDCPGEVLGKPSPSACPCA